MKFWQWASIALVIVGLGLFVRPAPGMAATWNRTVSALGSGDMWLMGDPDSGGGYQGPGQGYSPGYRLTRDPQGNQESPRFRTFLGWLLMPLRYLIYR